MARLDVVAAACYRTLSSGVRINLGGIRSGARRRTSRHWTRTMTLAIATIYQEEHGMKTRAELDADLISKAAEDEGFRSLLREDPRKAVSQAVGWDVPDDIKLVVHEEDSATFHLVLPASDRLSNSDMARISAGAMWSTTSLS